MPHWRTFKNFTHRALAICNLSNHDLFGTIPDPGRQKRITLSVESIRRIPLQAGTSYVKILEWGQHCSNREIPCIVCISGNFQGTWHQPKENPGAPFWCTVEILSNITNLEIKQRGMLFAWKIGQGSLVGCTNDWHNGRSGRKLIVCMPPPVTSVHLNVYLATFRVFKAHWFTI